MQISKRNELLQVVHESARARVPKVSDVVNMRSGGRYRSPQDLLQAGTVNAWAEPVRAHVIGGCCVIFPGVLHGKGLSERPAKTGKQPIFIILYWLFRLLVFLHKIVDYLHNQIFRESMKMELYRMQRPVAAPVVVQVDLDSFVFLIHAFREQVLNSRILGKRDMRADVKQKSLFGTKGRRMAAVVIIFVIHRGRNALGMQPVSRTEARHSGPQNDDVCHKKSFSCLSWYLVPARNCVEWPQTFKSPSYRSICVRVSNRRSAPA